MKKPVFNSFKDLKEYLHKKSIEEKAIDDFLEKLSSAPPLISKQEVTKLLPRRLQFKSIEEVDSWESTACREDIRLREIGIEKLLTLFQRRAWLVDILAEKN